MQQDQFNKPYSDDTARLIDEEVRAMIDVQYERAQTLLNEKREELNALANALLENEVLHKSDVERLIGARPVPEAEIVSPVTSLDAELDNTNK